MKIDVAKIILEKDEEYKFSTYNYKIINRNYCCEDIENSEYIKLTYSNYVYDISKKTKTLLHGNEDHSYFCVAFSYDEKNYDGYEEQISIPILYCPFCGEKIEINIVEEIDMTERLKELENKIKEINALKNATDSRKKYNEYNEEYIKLNNELNDLYKLGDLKIN